MAEMNRPLNVIERDTHWEINVNRKPVTGCFIDNRFTIDVSEREFILAVHFGGEFTYITATTDDSDQPREYRLEAGTTPTSLCPALSVLHKSTELVSAYKAGRIEVRFIDGSVLKAASDPKYESWEITGADGLLIVCTPGGKLAVWLPKYDSLK